MRDSASNMGHYTLLLVRPSSYSGGRSAAKKRVNAHHLCLILNNNVYIYVRRGITMGDENVPELFMMMRYSACLGGLGEGELDRVFGAIRQVSLIYISIF